MGVLWFSNFTIREKRMFENFGTGWVDATHLVSGITGIDGYAFYGNGGTGSQAIWYFDYTQSYDEIYVAFKYRPLGDRTYAPFVLALYHGGDRVAQMFRTAGSPRELYVMGNTTTYGQATGYSCNNNTTYLIEWRVKIADSGGVHQVWVNDDLAIDYSGDTKDYNGTKISRVLACCNGSGFNTPWSYTGEFIFSTERIHPTYSQAKKIVALKPNGAGSNSQMTGAYTDVDNFPADDATMLYTNSNDQLHTLALENMPANVESVDAVQVWNRTVAEGSPTPRNMKPAIYTHSNAYVGDGWPVTRKPGWYGRKIWALNPYTSAAWTKDEVDALEAGAKSAA